MRYWPVMMVAAGILVSVFVGTMVPIGRQPAAPDPSEGEVLFKICRDGTRIYRWRDDTFHAKWPPDLVDDPASVCASGRWR